MDVAARIASGLSWLGIIQGRLKKMNYAVISIAHIATAVAAMTLGAFVVGLVKGTYRHKVIGYSYVVSMLALNASALLIYRLTGKFGPFHVMALISLLTLLAGFIPVFFRWPRNRWLALHLNFMSWSFIGLLMAAASELAVRLPGTPFLPGVIAGSLLTFVGGRAILARNKSRLLSSFAALGAQPGFPPSRE